MFDEKRIEAYNKKVEILVLADKLDPDQAGDMLYDLDPVICCCNVKERRELNDKRRLTEQKIDNLMTGGGE